jgi:hypothetical protein
MVPNFAHDPIPAKGIRLSEAFRRVLKALLANPTLVEPTLEEYDIQWKEDLKKIDQRWRQEAAANAFFRCHLIWGEKILGENLYAFVRDPDSGLILQLDPIGWGLWPRPPIVLGRHKRSTYEPISTGIDSDYVIDPYDESDPGPGGTFISGAYRPVFFWRDEFERWFQKTFGADPLKRRGRKPGSGSWENEDRPFLQEMNRLIESGSAKSPEDAAGQVAKSARGASFESTRTRLAKRYRKQHQSE